jgi:hypothetical protein
VSSCVTVIYKQASGLLSAAYGATEILISAALHILGLGHAVLGKFFPGGVNAQYATLLLARVLPLPPGSCSFCDTWNTVRAIAVLSTRLLRIILAICSPLGALPANFSAVAGRQARELYIAHEGSVAHKIPCANVKYSYFCMSLCELPPYGGRSRHAVHLPPVQPSICVSLNRWAIAYTCQIAQVVPIYRGWTNPAALARRLQCSLRRSSP